MSVVKNDSADGFVRRPPKEIRLFLSHGLDEGLIHERAKTLVASILAGDTDPIRLMRMDGDAVAADPGRLADEAYAISMFGGSRAIWIEAQSRDLVSALTPMFDRPPPDCSIVVEAGYLKKGAALRVAFESSTIAVSIECYPDERRALVGLIDAEAQEAGVNVTPEAREFLLALLGSDRLTSRGEIVKLMLYARGGRPIEVGDVEAIVADAAPSGLEAAVDQALFGDIAETERAAARYFGDGGDASLLLIRLVARVGLLHRIRLDMDQGRSFEAALQGQRLPPAVHTALAKQAERWTSAALGKRLPVIQAVTARARRDTRLGQAIATRALWALASGARQSRR